jgi:hypothetical protein
MSIIWILLQSFLLHLLFPLLSLATGKRAVCEIKRQLEFTHCEGLNILYSVKLICKFPQYYQIKLYGNFNNITAGVTWRLKLNATCLLIWPFWLPYTEQFHSMNESTITSRSAWKLKWLPTEQKLTKDQREGVYTMLESEQFMWTIIIRGILCVVQTASPTKLCATADENFVLQMFLLLLTRALQLHCIKRQHPL